ncbi:HLH-domain-containing protein [Trametes versicolor FP-101664 SS1]|uniref:HLH-domain-containing protein n=1 Tax=Trametes versicolor (strain FP-101664) TaxID=717944 RepID=R7S7M4_TRAVS|nr:HLH-domain-containing protein [Trametes versicolor FP-101664 SS1]EIW51650.1 HLH-domain-containing protein [Trametes versicolor FP-101664 SS1]
MSSSFFPSYKPQVLSRQEGFHLPSPPPSNSPPSPPANSSSNGNGSGNFDNLFVPPLFSVPDPFRKFPSHHSDQSSSGMDFTDELASLIGTSPSQGHPHNSSHERSTQSPGAYDEYRSHHTHNIFDISAPTSHHQSSHHNNSNHFGGHQNPSFSLPPASSLHSANIHGSSSVHSTHPIHEFSAHSHFNSTVPAIGSSMRYEPPSNNPSSPTTGNGNNPFAGGEPSSYSSHISNLSGISSFPNINGPSDFHLSQPPNSGPNGQRQTPSPVSANGGAEFSRSRSRSRAPSSAMDPAHPPSTNGGPARRTRTKRNSVSSVSPPPLHRGHTQPLVIPNGNSAGRGPASPLSLHTSGWFMPQGQGNEFGLPTPESVHGFNAFNGGTSLGSVGLGVSPKEVNVPGMGIVGMQKGESPPEDMATKHRALIANEKRRRRRESHNAVERRRRDNINEKISELATLIPECLLDPNATISMPASLSASGEDLIFGGVRISTEKKEGSGSVEPEDANPSSTPTTANGASAANGGDNGNAVKANKGMILRKSVEYIRYLQQLVSAQANRNRDLEQQLHAFRGGVPPSAGSPASAMDSDGELKLLPEVEFAGLINGSGANGDATPSATGRARRGSMRKSFHEFGLPSVEEMDQDTEHGDLDRPSTSGTGVSPGSSMDDDLDDDVEEDGDEDEDMEERGRKGRDGRPVGVKRVGRKAKSVSVDVKVKKESERVDGMEVS